MCDKFFSRMLVHSEYEFLLKVVDGVLDNPGQARFRQIRADIPVVTRVQLELEELGFVRDDCKYVLSETLAVDELRQRRTRIQAMVDMTLDPEKISLSQVAEVLQRNGRLPGIDDTINDEPMNHELQLGDGCDRPRKPWEN